MSNSFSDESHMQKKLFSILKYNKCSFYKRVGIFPSKFDIFLKLILKTRVAMFEQLLTSLLPVNLNISGRFLFFIIEKSCSHKYGHYFQTLLI